MRNLINIINEGQAVDAFKKAMTDMSPEARNERHPNLFGKKEVEEDAKIATIGEEDGKERIEAALTQLHLRHESSGPRGIHTNYGDANKFDSIDGALAKMASTKLRHYETLTVDFRKEEEKATDVIKDIARVAGLDLRVGMQTQSRDGSTWQHCDLYDGQKIIAVAGMRNASRHKSHPDFGSYILIDVKAEPLEEAPVEVVQQGHNNDVAIGSSDTVSPEEHSEAVKDAAGRVAAKRAARKVEAEKGE